MSKTKAPTILLKAGESIGDYRELPVGPPEPTYDVHPGKYKIQWIQTYFSFTFYGQCSSGTLGELESAITETRASESITEWLTNTVYDIDMVVVDPTTMLSYRCKSDHTSDVADMTVDLTAERWAPYIPQTYDKSSGSIEVIIDKNYIQVNEDCLVIRIY